MPRSLPIADAICAVINKETDQGVLQKATLIRSNPFAKVAVAPNLERTDSGKLRCFVEPVGRRINETEVQDACSDEWAPQIGIVFVQRLDDTASDEMQPGDIDEVRALIDLTESLADKLAKVTRIETKQGTARLDKSSSEHLTINRDFLRSRVFYSEMKLSYG